MKKRIALLTLVAASAVLAASLKKQHDNQKTQSPKPQKAPSVPIELSPSLPSLPRQSVLSNTLLESYRVQCQVMMDGYPEGMQIDLLHHVEAPNDDSYTMLYSSLRSHGYQIDEKPDQKALVIKQTIHSSAQEAFDAVVSVASLAQTEHALYQGWIFENCR